MKIHPDVLEAIDQIDAAFYSGDTFHGKEKLAHINRFLERWSKEAAWIKEMLDSPKDDE